MREKTSEREVRRSRFLGSLLSTVVAIPALAGSGWTAPAPCLPDIDVPGDFALIQDAVDAALPGERIRLGNGPFNENVVISTPNLTLQPQPGANPVLDGGLAGPTLLIVANGVTVENLEILGGNFAGIILDHVMGAVIVRNVLHANPAGIQGFSVENCEFRDNLAFDNSFAGFLLEEGNTGNLLVDNTAIGNEVGFLSFASGDTYSRNEASENDIGFEICGRDNLLRGNKARLNIVGFGMGTGLSCFSAGGYNTARRNEAKDNDFAFWVRGESQTLVENTILGGGKGIEVFTPGHEIRSNTATGCVEWGFALFFQLPSTSTDSLNGTTVAGNTAHECGLGFLTAANCVYLSENLATRCRGDGFLTTGVNNVLDRNKASRNGSYGFEDSSNDGCPALGGTAGTANTYVGNRCRHNDAGPSLPAGLCSE